MGSEFPIASLYPLLEMYRAVTWIDSSGLLENVWHPHACVTLAEALRAYTWVWHTDPSARMNGAGWRQGNLRAEPIAHFLNRM